MHPPIGQFDLFDATDPAFVADPYPTFAALRAEAPAHHHPGLGMIVALTHADCSALLRHRDLGRLWHDVQPAEDFAAFNLLHRNSLLESEPPRHTRLRRLISSAFARGHTERLRPWVDRLAERLVDDLAERIERTGSADVIEHLAAPLPVAVIAELLGVPETDRDKLRSWSNAIVKMYEYDVDPATAAAAETASAEFTALLRERAAGQEGIGQERVGQEGVGQDGSAGGDLIGDLVGIRDGGDALSSDELVATAVLLLMAGHEATVNVIGNGVHALLSHPGQWRRLVDDPGLVPTAVEELIRFDSPLQLFERTATAEVTVGGLTVRPGEKVAALLGAAARDPAVFADPDTLDVGRTPNPHLGFGAGIHYCVGAPLARVEVAAALRALIERLPGLRPAGEPRRRPEFVIRGLADLPVTA